MRLTPLLFALAFGVAAPAAQATQCQEQKLEQKLRQADVVFVGRALAWDAELATTFEVERVFKGKLPARVVATTQGNKYASMSPPDRFVVFAQLVDSAQGTGAKELLVHACGGTNRIVPGAPNDLAALGKGRPPAKMGGAPGADGGAPVGVTAPVESPADAGASVEPEDAAPPTSASAPVSDATSPRPRVAATAPSATPSASGPSPLAPPRSGCAGCAIGARERGPLWLSALALLLGLGARRRRVSSPDTSSTQTG